MSAGVQDAEHKIGSLELSTALVTKFQHEATFLSMQT